MKIAMIGPSYPFRGGISHYTTLLYRSLRKSHDVKFYAFKRQYPNWLFPGRTDRETSSIALREKEVENILDSLNPLSWLKVFIKIKKFSPELLILPWWVSFWTPQFWMISYLVRRSLGIKILFICHNVVEHEANFITKLCAKLVLKNGTYFIVHSEEELKNLRFIIPDAKVNKTFHPTYEVFRQNGWDKEKAKAILGISGNIVLFFGFIRPYKGLKYLIEALPDILKKVDVTLLIAGEFWKGKSSYLQKIEELEIGNRVKIFDEYIPNEEVSLYFSSSDIVVLPYTSVTGSGVVQVALGLNKPVITSNIGSLPELIEHGKTGYVVNSCNAREIADAVITFYKENKEQEFVKNIDSVKEKFSWDRMVETIESFSVDGERIR